MLIVAVVVLGAALIIVKTLNAATWKADRLRPTNATFALAKEALIARAVADNNRPGSLPCPDTDGDGVAELFAGNQCPSYIGRLPWRTLELPDIRDAEGERLWYVLSRTHRDNAAAEPINSNTAGEITMNGALPATQVLAVLISPGRPLIRAGAAAMQQRDCPVNCNLAANYLDSANGFDNAVWTVVGGVVNLVYVQETDFFNDRLVPVLADDIMPLVEKRAAREIARGLRAQYEAWRTTTGRGFYPWAAPLNDPANPGPGVSGTLHGHLPDTANQLVWTSASANLGACVGVGTPTLVCMAVLLLSQTVNVTGEVADIATRFSTPPPAPTMVGITVPASDYSWTLNGAAQRLEFNYSADLLGVVVLVVDAPSLASWAPTGSPWLVNNRWNEVATYAISHGHKITGPGVCDAPNPCISTGGSPDKEAVVMMVGRPLAAQARAVPAQLADYLEGGNLTPADMQLERNLPTPAFNDQPVAVWP